MIFLSRKHRLGQYYTKLAKFESELFRRFLRLSLLLISISTIHLLGKLAKIRKNFSTSGESLLPMRNLPLTPTYPETMKGESTEELRL
jgi:hypothetical protein